MAPRVNKIRHDENTRTKIQVAKYMNIMDECIDGKRKLNPDQLKCIDMLMARALPVLQSVEISAEITTSKVIRTPAPTNNLDTWKKQFEEKPETLQ